MYMKTVIKSVSKLNKMHMVLSALLLLTILVPVPIPFDIASYIDTKMGSLTVIILSIVVFLTVNPMVGILAFVAGYVLLHRASLSTGSEVKREYVPSEEQKQQDMMNLHEHQGKTLEEEAVANIPPRNPDGDLLKEGPFQPVYSDSVIEHSEL